MTSTRLFVAGLVVVLGSAPSVVFGQQSATKTFALPNQSATRPQSTVTKVTATVTNKSRTAVTDGSVLLDDGYASCDANFRAIPANGGTASSSCNLEGGAVIAKVAFNAANGTAWYGVTGDGQAFVNINLDLTDPK